MFLRDQKYLYLFFKIKWEMKIWREVSYTYDFCFLWNVAFNLTFLFFNLFYSTQTDPMVWQILIALLFIFSPSYIRYFFCLGFFCQKWRTGSLPCQAPFRFRVCCPVLSYPLILPNCMEFLRHVRMKDYRACIKYLYKVTFSPRT